jgi:hypothetical protein
MTTWPERDIFLFLLIATFADRGCRVVSATDPHGRILGFLYRSRYYFKLALTSPTNGGRSVGIIRLRTKATEVLLIDT